VEGVFDAAAAEEGTFAMNLLALLLTLVIIGILLWAAKRILGVLPIDEPIKTVVYVLIVVIACLYVLQALFGFVPGIPVWRWR
jgi:hypothetical protein